MRPLPASELDEAIDIVATARGSSGWGALRGARVFLTGGTGFFGSWLIATLLRADRRFGLGSHVVVLTRDPNTFQRRFPALATDPRVRLEVGDVRDFAFPAGRFTHVVHAATAASAALNENDPRTMFDTIVDGTARTLAFARAAGVSRVLLVSSGAIYGHQPSTLDRLDESFRGGPDPADPGSAYAEGKRVAEFLSCLHARETGATVTIARGFAFVGPLLPLDAHFAVGNFLRDALRGGPIRVNGDGTPLRSYLYASDLAAWLWTILLSGRSGRAYNVGSPEAISIANLARTVGDVVGGGLSVEIARTPDPGSAPARYVPCVRRIADELGLTPRVDLKTALTRTTAWHVRS